MVFLHEKNLFRLYLPSYVWLSPCKESMFFSMGFNPESCSWKPSGALMYISPQTILYLSGMNNIFLGILPLESSL